MAARTDGLRVVALGDAAGPVEVGALALPGVVWDIAVAGRYAYAADYHAEEGGGLTVYDVADPAAPALLATVRTPNAAASVAVAGPYTALAFDRADPNALAVRGPYVYMAAEDGGLRVFDAADPVAPVEVGAVQGPGPALQVRVAGRYAYAAAGNCGLGVVDVADPARPRPTARYDLGGVSSIAIAGDLAYALTSSISRGARCAER